MRNKIPGLQGKAKNLARNCSSKNVWKLLLVFDEIIISEIVTHTNYKLQGMWQKLKENQSPNYKDTDCVDIDALIGLLMLSSIFKSGKGDISSFFSTGPHGRPIF